MGRLSLLASVVVVGFAALAACKGDDAPSTFDENKFAQNDAGEAPLPGPLVGDAGTPDAPTGPTGPTTCDPKIPDPFDPVWKAPQKAAACDATELTGYYDACLTDLDAADAQTKCATFRAAHDACTKCVEPTDLSGPYQWSEDRKLFSLNIAGCVSIVKNDTAGADCAEAYAKAVQCTRDACVWCIEAGGAYTTYQTCQNNARGQGVCASLEAARADKCKGITGTSGSANTCYLAQGETEKDLFVRVSGLFCAK